MAESKDTAGPPRLSRARHAQRDFFIADLSDISPKGDLASMEHPLFALKAGDKRIREYKRGTTSLQVQPGAYGCATIHDKDVWIYCISQLVEAMNRDRDDIGRTVRFTAYDFLVATNRSTDGDSYKRLGDALNRLAGTRIETNIETDGTRERAGFGLIDSWRVIERDRHDDRMVAIEVELPRWLYRSIEARHILTMSRDYFRLRRPLDRRLYELARKHCGAQASWRISLATLYEKSGSSATLREFRRLVKALVGTNDLPDYLVAIDSETDMVNFSRRVCENTIPACG